MNLKVDLLLMSAALATLASVLATEVTRADGSDLNKQYPEHAPDGSIRVIASWADGTYSFLLGEYTEVRVNGQVAKIYEWSNGRRTCVENQYPEQRGDGIYAVHQWCDGSWKWWPITLTSTVVETSAVANSTGFKAI